MMMIAIFVFLVASYVFIVYIFSQLLYESYQNIQPRDSICSNFVMHHSLPVGICIMHTTLTGLLLDQHHSSHSALAGPALYQLRVDVQ